MQLCSLVQSFAAAGAVACLAGAIAVAPAIAPAAADELKPVYLDAVIAEGASPLSDVSFTVERVQGGVVQEMRGGAAELQLPAGRYKVRASFGQTEVEQDIVVDAASTRHTINLNAGEVELTLINDPTRPMNKIKGPIEWRVLTYGRDATGKRQLLHQAKASTARFTLPAGWYRVEADYGGITAWHPIEVTAGAAYAYSIVKPAQ
jgi:hypothetical protein